MDPWPRRGPWPDEAPNATSKTLSLAAGAFSMALLAPSSAIAASAGPAFLPGLKRR